MKEFNTALLGKWCWRMLVDKTGLLYRVLVARYGEEAGCQWGGAERFFVVEGDYTDLGW
ncbi:receptor-like kinase [Trifolium medium]|nr:receptor-like kinase [Trifolium medium]